MFNFNLLPKSANNKFSGNKIALWGFILFTALMTWRSIIHMFFEEYGFHDIANFKILSGDPDPNPIIYRFFSLWGLEELIICILCWIVIFRYKSLIPLMYVLWIFEWAVRLFYYPIFEKNLDPNLYTTGPTPGVEGAPYALAILVALFLLSIKKSSK
tara:strand:- start:672 stop:1142 length:471 start_codon:yes stop_codon:yes gene_type:complete